MLIKREPRIQKDSSCRCVIDGQDTVISGKVKNVSETGLLISSPFAIPSRSLIHLIAGCDEQETYTIKDVLTDPNKVSGRVVRGDPETGYGIQLLKNKTDRSRLPTLTYAGALTVEVAPIEDAAVLALSGCLDVTGAATLDRIAKEALKETHNLMLIMSEVESVLSSGIGVLINLFRDVNRRGGRLVIASPSTEVKRVLSVSRADQLVSCYPTEEEAMQALRDTESEAVPAAEFAAPGKESLPTVLVLEDDPHSFRLVKLALGYDFRMIRSSNVEEGIRLAARNQPDVVLLDLHFPGGDSSRVVQCLRAAPETSSVPILAVTNAKAEGADELTDPHVDDCIVRPYQSQELLKKIRTLIAESPDDSTNDSP